MGYQPGAAKKQTPPPREEDPDMSKRTDKTILITQARIRQNFGPARIPEARDRLCAKCIFKEQHGRPCRLYPITLEGKDCQYCSRGDQYPKEVEWHG